MQTDDTTETTFITLGKKAIDITSQQFSRLTALGPISRGRHGAIMWLCSCICGKTTTVRSTHLRERLIMSCGCLHDEVVTARNTTHGKTDSKLYHIWSNIIRRCNKPAHPYYADYGGRGIQICREWQDSFEVFYNHVSNLPYYDKKGYTLDRANNSLGYFPDNMRWATWTEQQRNRRSNRLITFKNKTQSAAAWSEELGIPSSILRDRLDRGWSTERAFTTEIRRR